MRITRPWQAGLVCSIFDAILVAILIMACSAFLEFDIIGVIVRRPALALGGLLGVLAVVAWRGAADGRRRLRGHGSPRLTAEGFIAGFIPYPLSQVFGIAATAYAAGPPWPPAGAPSQDWVNYWIGVVGESLPFGLAGAVVGFGLSLLNRGVISLLPIERALAADKSRIVLKSEKDLTSGR